MLNCEYRSESKTQNKGKLIKQFITNLLKY